MGETFDETKMQTMNVGNFVTVSKEMRHFAMSKGETIVQVHGAGPFWVNPSEVQPPDVPAPAPAKPKPDPGANFANERKNLQKQDGRIRVRVLAGLETLC